MNRERTRDIYKYLPNETYLDLATSHKYHRYNDQVEND